MAYDEDPDWLEDYLEDYPDGEWLNKFFQAHPQATDAQARAAWEGGGRAAWEAHCRRVHRRFADNCRFGNYGNEPDGSTWTPKRHVRHEPDDPPSRADRPTPEPECPMRVGRTAPARGEALELRSHNIDRAEVRLADFDRAHDDASVAAERRWVAEYIGSEDEDGLSYSVEHDPEFWRRTATGRRRNRSSAVRITGPDGSVTYRDIGNDCEAITEWLTRDGRTIADWQQAFVPNRPDSDTGALREALGVEIRALLEMGANRGEVAQVLRCSLKSLRSLAG